MYSGTVDEVLPRRSELQDPAVANVDQVLLVFALERPPLDLRTATRWEHTNNTSAGHTTRLFGFSLFGHWLQQGDSLGPVCSVA